MNKINLQEKSTKITIIILIILAFGSIYFLINNFFVSPMSKIDQGLMSSCQSDSDCTIVPADCCGCNAGGENTAININYREQWSEKLADECKNVFCPQVMSDHWTCFAGVECKNNVCTLVEK